MCWVLLQLGDGDAHGGRRACGAAHTAVNDEEIVKVLRIHWTPEDFHNISLEAAPVASHANDARAGELQLGNEFWKEGPLERVDNESPESLPIIQAASPQALQGEKFTHCERGILDRFLLGGACH